MLNQSDPFVFQRYTFTPSVDPARLPVWPICRVVFKEKSLGTAHVQVYQASTGLWHTFELDTLSTDDQTIDTIVDLSGALQTAQDFANVEVRFLAFRIAGGEKAEVNLVSLRLAQLVGETTGTDRRRIRRRQRRGVWGGRQHGRRRGRGCPGYGRQEIR